MAHTGPHGGATQVKSVELTDQDLLDIAEALETVLRIIRVTFTNNSPGYLEENAVDGLR